MTTSSSLSRPSDPHLSVHPGHSPAGRSLLGRGVLLCVLLLVCLPLAAVPARGEPVPEGPGDTPSPQARWLWPTSTQEVVVRPYEEPPGPYAPGHRGVDLRAEAGSDVLAVEDGTVRFAGPVAGRGVVSILHADGLLSTYEPVDATVSAGDTVRAGDVIGTVSAGGSDAAASHCAPQACLHLGARRGGTYQNPYPLLMGARPSVLLPLGLGTGAADAARALQGTATRTPGPATGQGTDR